MMLSLIVDGFIIIDYVSSAMMLSSIVYWIRLLQSLRQQSLRQQSLRQAWIRLEVTWENILCVLPPFFHWLLLLRVRVLVSYQSSYNSHRSDYCKSSSPIKLFALAQLSTARKLSCLYPRRHFSSVLFVVVQLYYYITLMDIVVIATIPSKE